MDEKTTYREEEIAEIFELAARTDAHPPHVPGDETGLTLGELQEVGSEVGLDPERIAAAAAEVSARSEIRPRKTAFGVPAVVEREVALLRAPTDEEWGLLVAGLREDCGSPGRDLRRGPIREWTCADVSARAAPADEGRFRLVLQAERDPSRGVTALGALVAVAGAALLASSGLDAATFGPTFEILLPALMSFLGGGAAAANVIRMRRWASTRERLFEKMSRRVREIIGT